MVARKRLFALVSLSLAFLVQTAICQAPNAASPTGSELTTQSSLVIVPALVRSKSGELVFNLNASDFALTDDGIPQKLTLEQDTGSDPLAMVVVIEVGGAGAREFDNDKLAPLAPMLENVVGNVPHRIAVVAFDSQPTLVQGFTSNVDAAAKAILDLAPGCSRQHHMENCEAPGSVHDLSSADNGAAILDALGFAVELLRDQPVSHRRAILLVTLPNRYVLSFHPPAPHPGFHAIALRLPNYTNLEVTGRRGYWTEKFAGSPQPTPELH